MKNKEPAREIFETMEREGCREIRFHLNPKTNMKAILIIDSLPNKKNGTVSGGTRFAHNNPDEALNDAVRLSRAMTRKANVLNVDEGGAKAVILLDNKKTKEFLESVGEFIETQRGLFKTAVDLGFNLKDASVIASKTKFIDSLSHSKKGLGSTGENTAEGMIHGFKVISKRILKKPLNKCSFAVQGLGAVGMALVKRLIKNEGIVFATDINRKLCAKANKSGARIVKPEEIFSQDVDIFSPCAFGGVLNKKTIPKLKCKIVAGGANNQLEKGELTEKKLLERGIIFIPDFVINSAGFLQALVERNGGTIKEAREKSKIVAEKLMQLIKFSENNNITLLQSSIKLFGGKNEN